MVGAQADRNLKDLPLGLNKEVAEEQKAALKQLLDKHNPSNPRS